MNYAEAIEIINDVWYAVEMSGDMGTPEACAYHAKELGILEQYDEACNVELAARPVDIGPVQIVNCTPHPITFQNGDNLISVPPSGITLKADAVEQSYGELPGVEFVKVAFVPSEEGQRDLDALLRRHPRLDVFFIGSIISAQAFNNERVVAMVPVPGFERVPPAEKRMRNDKFTVYRTPVSGAATLREHTREEISINGTQAESFMRADGKWLARAIDTPSIYEVGETRRDAIDKLRAGLTR